MRGLNLLVFRDDQRSVSGQNIKAELVEKLERLSECSSRDAWTGALLLAGEFECGLADCNSGFAELIPSVTDGIADALMLCESGSILHPAKLKKLIEAARAIPVFQQLNISTPEGFAYYALHPLAYADVMAEVTASENLLVVGIRSVGTTLSAVMAAAARVRGARAQRITVRPHGHPYDRSAEFSVSQLAVIEGSVAAGATFAVVDEGPGLSGSSFLSVAEALERAGAPREKIVLASSHAPNVDALCAGDAARRWPRFRCVAVTSEARRPVQAVDFIGGGKWRSHLTMNGSEWPASWTSFERLKYLSTDHGERRLFKFAGLGHYGDQVFDREDKVAAAGFGPRPRAESDGFISYPWMDGRPCSATDVSHAVLQRLAGYCAFRQRAFAVELSGLNALRLMAEHNLRELGLDLAVDLRLERPVLADARMQPHKWLLTPDGELLKTDSGSHGDDHFFPGPTDIAWDLAGAIVEWQMNPQQTADFLNLYRRVSGDDARARIDGFIAAYAVFRLAYCLMAANAMNGSEEQPRLQSAAAAYRALLTKMEARSLSAVQSLMTMSDA
jgi:adenine/guanine phosphoribosyltransferase-like PRPP-binding protein